jgi:hypothetical protein
MVGQVEPGPVRANITIQLILPANHCFCGLYLRMGSAAEYWRGLVGGSTIHHFTF